MNKLKILLLGSNGFIGRNVYEKIIKNPHFSLSAPKRKELDLHNLQRTKEYIKKMQPHVIFNSAYIGVNSSINYTDEYVYDNLRIVTNVLEGSRGVESIKKLFFLGSSLEYKDTKKKLNENDPLEPQNVYATTKMLCSLLSLNLARQWKLPLVLLRPFNLYGTYDNKSVIWYVINSILEKKSFVVTSGEQIRDYLYIEDFVSIMEHILEEHNSFMDYEVYNIGTGQATKLKTLFDIIFKTLDYNGTPSRKDPPVNEYWHNVADNSKLKGLIDVNAPTTLDTGIQKTINWIKSTHA